jgi:hypothetical protein
MNVRVSSGRKAMRIALLLVLAAAPVGAADRPLPSKPPCTHPGTDLAAGKAPRVGVHPLNQEPAAKQVLTVMRSIDGCVKPVVVREDLGQPRLR